MPTLTPQQFVERWQAVELTERASYQSHFIDLCRLVEHRTPTEYDSKGESFTFEKGVKKDTGAQGFADVWFRGHFAFEYKEAGKYRDLNEAYQQLQRYRENLENPPLLVVTDIAHWEIHTNFTNTAPRVYKFSNADIAKPDIFRLLKHLFFDVDRLRPDRDTVSVTKEAAQSFQAIVDNMREWQTEPERIAHFLTKLVFCLFAEDAGLLPRGISGERGVFAEIVHETRQRPDDFLRYVEQLFKAMADGGNVLMRDIPYFNGSLFADVDVAKLGQTALAKLYDACLLDWSAVEPSIFGTLFERSLDPNKRAQLGAHYTSRDDITLIVEPVLMQPLRREWAAVREKAAPFRAAFDAADTPRKRTDAINALNKLRAPMLQRLSSIKVLDPACGSGNFLYVSLQLLMDMEKEVITDPLWAVQGISEPYPEVHPRQLYGIELDPIAHGLASIVVWIGYLQWREQNGYSAKHREPILEAMSDHIVRMDAIMQFDENGKAFIPNWPSADVIVGNPPFLGAKKMRRELGNNYVNSLRSLYRGKLSDFSDLVTYWFEQARRSVEEKNVKRVGLIATNSISMGTNLPILKQIKKTGDIFMAWGDREWILEGAAVRIAIIAFDNGSEQSKILDGKIVSEINPDLTSTVNLTTAKTLTENSGMSFIGVQKSGPFEINQEFALNMMQVDNKTNVGNQEVLKLYFNAEDVVDRPKNRWIIDFGANMPLESAENYEEPFRYVQEHVYPMRQSVNRAAHRMRWWIHGDARPGMRTAIEPLKRYIATPLVSKHRIFVWLDKSTLASNLLIAIAREDDYFFGVLHSYIHEVWSLRMGTWLGKGNDPRYTPTTTFETFPFPYVPGKEDTTSSAYTAVAAAAKALDAERAAWLMVESKDRTLTNLYNALAVWRGLDTAKTKPDAADFAPRLADLHDALDAAVLAAYGWSDLVGKLRTADGDEEVLRRLLALNLARAGG